MPGPDWSRPLPRPLTIPDVLTLETLADIWASSSCSTIRSAMELGHVLLPFGRAGNARIDSLAQSR